MYALKSFEARRQYPRKLKLLFDFLNLSGSVDQQALLFLENVQKNQPLQQNNLLRFFKFQMVRVRHMELATATLRNYYRAIKLFCEMNDITFQTEYHMHLSKRLDFGIFQGFQIFQIFMDK